MSAKTLNNTARPWLGLDPFAEGLIQASWSGLPAFGRTLCQLQLQSPDEQRIIDLQSHQLFNGVFELWQEGPADHSGLLARCAIDSSFSTQENHIEWLAALLRAWQDRGRVVTLLNAGLLETRHWQQAQQRSAQNAKGAHTFRGPQS